MDPDRLAALLDGSLRGKDRQAAIAEVAAFSDDDLGVFADAATVLRERDEERAMTDDGSTERKRPDPPALVARKARADRLRPHVARWVEVRGVNAVAERAELKPDSIRAFINRGVTPQPGALDAFEEMIWNAEWRKISGEISTEDGGLK